MSTSPRQRQERTGRLALLLWLWGTLLSPLLHTWHHRADHVHGLAGVVRVADHDDHHHEHHAADHERHHHDEHQHHDAADHGHHDQPERPHAPGQRQGHRQGKPTPVPTPHGTGSADHFQLALIYQVLDLTPLGVFTLLPRPLAARPTDAPERRLAGWIARSRGPPAARTT